MKTCVRDSFVVAARWEGQQAGLPRLSLVSQKKVNMDLAHVSDEEMQIGHAVTYFREEVMPRAAHVSFILCTDFELSIPAVAVES